MRLTLIVALATSTSVLSQQLFFESPHKILDSVKTTIESTINKATDFISTELNGVRTFEQVESDGTSYEVVTHVDFPSYVMRLKEPKLCDTTVKSYSGYLDIEESKHIFFWFFESRNSPDTAPLALWLNGGPGCSSATGLLFELGPCSIANEGQNTTFNPHSWTESANVLFIDSPVNVGYSYGDKAVSNSQDTAEDIYAFMQIFYEKFPKFHNTDFHVSGESYAGTYIPNIGSVINKHNLELPTKDSRIIPLKSLLIGNGLTDAKTQFGVMPDYACAPSPYAIFDDVTCGEMRRKVSACQTLTQACYDSPNRFLCVPATLSCWQIAAPIQKSGLNPYDIRKTCDRDGKDGPLCYRQMEWIETYLNKPEIKAELGAPLDRTFESCNMKINQAFQFNGDVSHNTVSLLPPLLESGIRVLIYAGEMDFLCNWLGNEAWTLAMPWEGQEAFNNATVKEFYSTKSVSKSAGNVRSVGSGAGLFAFLKVKSAGHMVPYDQPEVSLDFFTRWINDKPLA